ncbi:proline-rich receptor-like protein kinase PERK10 [Perca fluviatilis]|uniref:proline-rich receptor-like protein kinase PERK10 n=1 Tax=Perca fluviatilis TaxID=8168 RepID=UPI0019657E86|nr:proline-rich receptor-like protein kinase PERK10 [Perca fluviatilis]
MRQKQCPECKGQYANLSGHLSAWCHGLGGEDADARPGVRKIWRPTELPRREVPGFDILAVGLPPGQSAQHGKGGEDSGIAEPAKGCLKGKSSKNQKNEISLIQQSLLSFGEGSSSHPPHPPQPQVAGSPPTAGCLSPAGCPSPKEIPLIQQSLLSFGEGSSSPPHPPQTQVAGSPPTAGCPSPAGCPPPEGCSSRLAEDEDDALELLFSSGRSEWDDDSVPDFSWLF